ncbi:hypothetical protein CORC01_13558 [Colletotrichum orchidophilum]|uniref:Uncharacterized protein n=1 Tax=Colletotrichum orchidophilum TaxID=1209926 RepID=A0A1G4APR4_9PEZI|nr:uncharacterized protein CORC01_13558 [Colletotrichum orchidophilum]OHE91147.1 hypothetical protein CORC01_13558 [Colletotrichum orchidophilum]
MYASLGPLDPFDLLARFPPPAVSTVVDAAGRRSRQG